MKIEVLAFGQIANVTGSQFQLEENIFDTQELTVLLEQKYPALRHLKYSIAVNKKVVHENTTLTKASAIALLPPFSGG